MNLSKHDNLVFFSGDSNEEDDVSDDLKAESKKVLEQACEFFLYGDVNRVNSENLISGLLKMARVKGRKGRKPTFVVNINSEGGDVNSGWAIAAAIQHVRSKGFRVETRVQGLAASMAFLLSQFADNRVIDALATAHIHDVQARLSGDTGARLDSGAWVDIQRLRAANIFARRNTAGYTDPQYWIDNYMQTGRNHFLTAYQAKELGLVDEVVGGYPTASA